MISHKLLQQAKDDLDEIWLFVARETGNLERADRLVDILTERAYLISRHPYIGRDRTHDLRPGIRSFPVGDWVIFYRVESDQVVILTILSGRRDLDAWFA